MIVTLDIPDEIAPQLTAPDQEISRSAMEPLALEAYRRGALTQLHVGRLLACHASRPRISWLNMSIFTTTRLKNLRPRRTSCAACDCGMRISSVARIHKSAWN
jgi:hypothetical protein